MIDDEGLALGVTTANWLDAPYNRWAFRRIPQVARTLRIGGSSSAIELPRAERDLSAFTFPHLGEVHTLDSLLAATSTDALIVLQDGLVITERYLDGMAPDDRHLLMSVSKSLTGTLCGVLVGQGKLSPGDPVTDLPAGSSGRRGTAASSSTCSTCAPVSPGTTTSTSTRSSTSPTTAPRAIRPSRRHGDLDQNDRPWAVRARRRPVPIRVARDRRPCLGDRAGGADAVSRALLREIWSAIGTEDDAEIMVDASGFPLAEGGFCATLRDCARFGLMCLRDGAVEGRQILPADWLARLLVPDPELVDAYRSSTAADPATPGAMYHDTWWVRDPERGVFAASGMNGQLILVHRPSRSVIVSSPPIPAHSTWSCSARSHGPRRTLRLPRLANQRQQSDRLRSSRREEHAMSGRDSRGRNEGRSVAAADAAGELRLHDVPRRGGRPAGARRARSGRRSCATTCARSTTSTPC